jgi:hypothetical protein
MADSPASQNTRVQAFPSTGPLFTNMNLDRRGLAQRLASIEARVYCYIVVTVERRDGELAQTGSGPNFQGGLLTLCTCKRSMRASKAQTDEWNHTWIAGLTGAHVGGPTGNYLFFVTRIAHTFASQRDLWLWLTAHSPASTAEKASDHHRLGDLYRPKDLDGIPFDPYDPDAYVPPRRDHPHALDGSWRKDIAYQAFGRWPALLAGAPEDTYLWSEPLIPVPFAVSRGYRIVDLSALLG